MLDFLSLVVTITLCVLFMYLATGFRRKLYPPGPWGFPILGHLPLLGKDAELKYQKWRQKYGDVFSIRLGSWNTIVVNGYEAIKDAADRKDDSFSGRPNFVSQNAMKEAFGGLEMFSFSNFSPQYLQLRKRTTMAIKQYMNRCNYSLNELFQEEADKLTEKLLRHPSDEPVSVDFDIELSVIGLLYQMQYGRGKEDEIEPHLNFIIEQTAFFSEFVSTGNLIDVMPWLRYFMKSKIEQFKSLITASDWITKSKIDEHRNSFQRGQIRDILDALCGLSEDLPDCVDEDNISATLLQFQVSTLQGAGFDTTTRTLQFIILYLIKYPDVQQRVQKEIDQVIGSNRNVSEKVQANFPYLMATILEVMRVTTVAPFAVPHYTLRDTTLQGFHIDKDTVVIFNLHSAANEESFWGDPENFRPERLLDDNGFLDKEKSSHILTFGTGRRQCPGETIAKASIFIFISTLLQRCTFQKPDGCELDLEPNRGLVLSPKPFKVIVKPR